MKFEELKKSLRTAEPKNYMITGDDAFLMERSYSLIQSAYNIEFEELNVIKFNGESLDFEQVVKALQTLPAFSLFKLVFVDLSTKLSKILNIKKMEEYLESPNSSSILVVKVGENDSQFGIKNKDLLVEVDCSRLEKPLAKKFIENEFLKLGKKLTDNDAFDLLYSYTNGDLANALNEIVKLSNFVGEKQEISREDIEKITIKNLEFQIFELTENLGKKNAKLAFEILEELKSRKEGYKGVLGLIYNHFRRLLHVSLNSNLSCATLAGYLGVKEYAISKVEQQLKYFSKKKLKDICDLCADLDFKSKNSMISLELAVELLVLKILE